MLAKGGHCLDQLIDLGIEEMLPIAGLQIFYLIGSRAQVPVLHRDGIGRAVNCQPQVIGLARDDEIQGVDRRSKEEVVLIAWKGIRIGDRILAIAAEETVEIVARPAG